MKLLTTSDNTLFNPLQATPVGQTPGGKECTHNNWHACKVILPQQGLVRLLRPGGQEMLDQLAIAPQNAFSLSGHECAPAWLPPLYKLTDKTGGYPRRVCRVSRVSVHEMTVTILWTVFSETARPSVGYGVLNSFQHHLFREIGVSSAWLAKAQSSSTASNCSYGSEWVAVPASVSSFDPPKESVHIAAVAAVAAACTADRWLLSCTWTPNLNKLWA